MRSQRIEHYFNTIIEFLGELMSLFLKHLVSIGLILIYIELAWSTSPSAKPPKMQKGNRSFEVKMTWKGDPKTKHWLFDSKPIYKGPQKLKGLAQVKKLELEEKFEACTEQVLKVWPQYSQFQGWLALQGSRCLLSHLKSAQPQKLNVYTQWWKHLEKKGHLLYFGPWSEEGIRAYSELSQLIWKNVLFPLSFRAETGAAWRRWSDSYSRSDRQELIKIETTHLESLGEKNWSQALLEREGLITQAPSLPSSPPSPVNKKNGTEKLPEMVVKLSEEDELYQSFLELIKQNQLAGAAEKGVKLLNLFPNGVRSNTVQEKLFQTYFNLLDSPSSPEQQAQLDRSLDTAKLLHSSRILEWAKASHRRGDFKGAYRLAKLALLDEEKSPEGAALLFIAGRSAFLSGEYQESISFFDRLIQRHGGYSDVYEAKFRKALAFLRLGKDDKAEVLLGDLWSDPENKTYSLGSLYWLIRLKIKRKGDIDELIKAMQDRFFLTYYGLKLTAELNEQKILLPSESNSFSVIQKVPWTPAEKKYWDRARELAQAGWYWAAQGELNNLSLNGSQEMKLLWVQQLAEVFAYPQAIRLYNELVDADVRWRKANYLRLVFPKPLENVVNSESQKNELNPLLVYSLMRQESAFSLAATSRSQAKGLMQLIPATANDVAQELRVKFFDSDQMYHPLTNIKFGTYYLAKVIRQFGGNVSVGLAAYNAGPHRLKKFFEARSDVQNYSNLSQVDPWSDLWIEELPWLETNLYVKSILRNQIIYQLLEQGSLELSSPTWKGLFLGSVKN